MSAPTAAIPTKDQYTNYDYNMGAARMSAVRCKQFEMEYLDETVQQLGFQKILDNPFNEQFRLAFFSGQCHVSKQVLGPKLKVSYRVNDGDVKTQINALTKEKTIEFARKAVASWGGQAEKVLSATETGSLYWNVIHHFGSFDAFLLEVDPMR